VDRERSAAAFPHPDAEQMDTAETHRQSERPPHQRGGAGGRSRTEPERESRRDAAWHRRPPIVIGGLILIVAAIIAGTLWWLEARQWESTDDAFIDAHMVRIAPRVAGRVLRVPVDDNQAVTAGQTLVEIDPKDFQVAVDQARAAAASAQGKLAQAQAQRAVADANVAEAEAQVGIAEANANNADRDLRRLQALKASGSPALSQQQLDTATATAVSANASLVAARKRVDAVKAQRDLLESQIAAAAADLDGAKAQLEQAQLTLSYATVKTPIDGYATRRNVSPGDYVQLGQNLMALVPKSVWITANFKETQLDLMRPQQPVEITVDAYPGRTLSGHVESIQHGSGTAFSILPPENATGNYVKIVQRVPVKIVIDGAIDPGIVLGPGMSVVPSVKVR
jgi:membrane fusion protein (multidrug efflux system)